MKNSTAGLLRLLRHLRHAAENEECDAADREAVAAGNEGVPEFVKDDRGKKAEGAGDAHPPVGAFWKSAVIHGEKTVASDQTRRKAIISQLRSMRTVKSEEVKKFYLSPEHLPPPNARQGHRRRPSRHSRACFLIRIYNAPPWKRKGDVGSVRAAHVILFSIRRVRGGGEDDAGRAAYVPSAAGNIARQGHATMELIGNGVSPRDN